MQVDVGAGVIMQAEAASLSSVLVDVGLGFRLECDIAGAQDIASLHMSTAKVSHLRSHTTAHIQKIICSLCPRLGFSPHPALHI